jgi:hypothetical protein
MDESRINRTKTQQKAKKKNTNKEKTPTGGHKTNAIQKKDKLTKQANHRKQGIRITTKERCQRKTMSERWGNKSNYIQRPKITSYLLKSPPFLFSFVTSESGGKHGFRSHQ